MASEKTVIGIDSTIKNDLVPDLKAVKKASDDLFASLSQVLGVLQKIENQSLGNVKNKAKTINNNMKMPKSKHSVVGSQGAMFEDGSNKSKIFKDYEQTVLDTQKAAKEELVARKELNKAIKEDTQERKNLRKQYADAVKETAKSRTIAANAKLLSARKAEDKSTADYADFRRALTQQMNDNKGMREFRSKHPEMFAAGGQNWNWRYQTAKTLNGVGNAAAVLGFGGRVAGDVLQVIGAFFKSPWAGAAVAITKLSTGVADLGKAAVEAFSQIESIRTQLGVVFSNQTQADEMFSQISRYAIKSPFGVQQTSELAVLLKQSGVYASDLMDTLRMLGDTASGNMEKMKRIANNYAQIVSIGKASMLDMRQFAYAGIPIFEAVSKELKVSQQELRKMISDGKVTSDIIEKVFKDLTGINGIFENATEKGAKTLKARLQNLSDARQLAFSSLGERVVYAGARTGNDSAGLRIVSWAEKMFQWMKEHNDLKNIERDVNLIANSDARIETLKETLEYAKEKGDKQLEKLIQTEIENQKNIFTPDKIRSVYSTSYDLKRQEYENYKDTIGVFSRDNIEKMRKEYSDRAIELWSEINTRIDMGTITKQEEEKLLEQVSLYRTLAEEMKNFEKSILKSITVTKEEIKAHKEKLAIDAQQLAYDKTAKMANASGSLNSSFEELYSLYKDSDEYKQKMEKETIKRLEEAKAILNKIADNTDEKGNVNLSKYKGNVKELYDLLQRGAFTPGQKLDIVTGNSAADHENRNLLIDQLEIISSAIREDFKYSLDNSDALKAFSGSTMTKLRYGMSDTKFYDTFSSYFREMQLSLDELEKNAPSSSVQENVRMYKTLLPVLLSTLNAETEGRFANPYDVQKGGTSYEFIPLWKRILAQGTGLTAQGMTSTKQTMQNYQNDMAIRNMAAGVLSATFKSVGLGSAMGLMRSNELKQLRGDVGGTYQINWQETKKAMHDFATQLSASTDVIAAYKKGLEDELNVYQELVAAGYTQAESQDIKNQKLVNTKTIAKLAMDAGDQLVNAFGEEFVTASGQKAYLHDDGQFYDAIEGGNKIQEEELRLTGNLFKMIEQRLGQLYSEIHEANAAELNNNALGNMLKEVAPTSYMSKVLGTGVSTEQLAFLGSNAEYIQSFINTKIPALKSDEYRKEDYAILENKSVEDIIMNVLTANGELQDLYNRLQNLYDLRNKQIKEDDIDTLTDSAIEDVLREISGFGDSGKETVASIQILNEAFDALGENVSKLTDNKNFYQLNELIKNLSKTKALNTATQGILGAYSLENTPFYLKNTPENYGGKRGDRNWLYKALGWNTDLFDKEDLYLAAANAGFFKDANGKNRYQDENGKSTIEGLNAEEFAALLESADKKAVDMAYHFERIAQAIDDMNVGLAQSLRDFAKGAYLAPFEQLGDYLVTDNDYAEGLKDKMKALGAELVSQMGTYMARAGFSLVAMGAETANYGLVAGGLALAAAGGFASGLGGALKQTNKDDKDKDIQKLENLKSDLQKLLEQARIDALYYENNLRHKTALGINKDFSYKSVHDAVITKKGDVITTDPRDYLFATKNPQQLFGGGNVTVTPVINCNVVNNTNSRVRQEQVQNADGSIDILTIIDEAVGDYIASSRSDDAFSAREYRIKGRQAIM